MSELGQKPKPQIEDMFSALPPEADIAGDPGTASGTEPRGRNVASIRAWPCGKGLYASDVQLGAADPSQQYPKAWEFMISLKVGSSSRNLRRIRLMVARTFVRYP